MSLNNPKSGTRVVGVHGQPLHLSSPSMEGTLQLETKALLNKKWKKHFVKLAPTEILIYKGETGSGDIQQRIEITKDVQVSGMSQAKSSFKLSNGKETLQFQAEQDTYKQWTDAFTETLMKAQFPAVADKASHARERSITHSGSTAIKRHTESSVSQSGGDSEPNSSHQNSSDESGPTPEPTPPASPRTSGNLTPGAAGAVPPAPKKAAPPPVPKRRLSAKPGEYSPVPAGSTPDLSNRPTRPVAPPRPAPLPEPEKAEPAPAKTEPSRVHGLARAFDQTKLDPKQHNDSPTSPRPSEAKNTPEATRPIAPPRPDSRPDFTSKVSEGKLLKAESKPVLQTSDTKPVEAKSDPPSPSALNSSSTSTPPPAPEPPSPSDKAHKRKQSEKPDMTIEKSDSKVLTKSPSSPAQNAPLPARKPSLLVLNRDTIEPPPPGGSIQRGALSFPPPELPEMLTRDISVSSLGPNAEQRTKIAREIVATEQSYVAGLFILQNCYRVNLLKTPIINVTAEQLNGLFPNSLTVISSFNEQLLAILMKDVIDGSNTNTIGLIFSKHVAFLKMYTDYSSDYQNCINNYNKLVKESPAFKAALDACRAASQSKLFFEDYIIMPVQRVPRYSLLLSDLSKHTEPSHPDYKLIQDSLQQVISVATFINESMKKVDNVKRIASLEAKGANFDNLYLPHRHLVKEGTAKFEENKRKEGKAWFLFNDILVHIASSNLKGGIDLSLSEYCWPLNLIWFEEAEKKIQLIGPNVRTLQLSKKDKEAMAFLKDLKEASSAWCAVLNEKDSSQNNNDKHRKGRYTFTEGGTYDGDWERGVRHGEGAFTVLGSVYEGSWDCNKQNGKGKLTYSTGLVYEGDWKNGLQHGKGTLSVPKGETVYVGDWVEGLYSGKGKAQFPNGDVYDGDFFHGRAMGQGTLTTSSKITYEGGWKDDHFEGRGTLKLPSGLTYVGQWRSGTKQGKGKMEYPGGAVYNGEWQDDLRQGKGEFKDEDGSVYDGEWKDDMQEGKGVKTFPNGARYDGMWFKGTRKGLGVCVYKDGTRFEGTWLDDRRHGTGTMMENDGTTYVGEWQFGRKEGRGTITFVGGAKYEGFWAADKYSKNGIFTGGPNDLYKHYDGEWLNGKMNGKGTLTLKNGDVFKGTFKDNKFQGNSVYTYANGVVLTGKWKDGVKEGKGQLLPDRTAKDGFNGSFDQNSNCLSTPEVQVFLPPAMLPIPIFYDDSVKIL